MSITTEQWRPTAQAICSDCGQSVRWALFGSGNRRVKLTPGELVTVVDAHNRMRQVISYTVHACDEQMAQTWKDLVADEDAQRAAYETFVERMREFSLTRDCPKCGESQGTLCYNLTVYRRENRKVPTRLPHAERVPEPKRIEIAQSIPGWVPEPEQ